MSERLAVIPMTLKEARVFVSRFHRHHRAPQGGLFAIGCAGGGEVVGVVIVGRPVARRLQDGYTAEVTRLCTDGSKNACSMLYAAAWRTCKAMGYRRLITYILESETGTSLKAAGWKNVCRTARRWLVERPEQAESGHAPARTEATLGGKIPRFGMLF